MKYLYKLSRSQIFNYFFNNVNMYNFVVSYSGSKGIKIKLYATGFLINMRIYLFKEIFTFFVQGNCATIFS